MKVSKVTLELSGSDILSIIQDFIVVKGLSIKSLLIEESLMLKGSYDKIIKIPFSLFVELAGVKDNIILLRLKSASIGKVGIFKVFRDGVLKILTKKLKGIGIEFKEDYLHINIDQLLQNIPVSLNFNIHDIKLVDKILEVKVEDIYFSLAEKVQKAGEVAVVREDVEIQNSAEKSIVTEKVADVYSKVRDKVEDKAGDKYKELINYVMILPDIITLFYRLFRDKRVPLKIKFMVGAILTYLASPIEILPDFIPFVGKIDDLAVAFFALNKIMNEIPENIIIENWEGRDDIILKVKEGIEYINRIAGGTNVGKLIQFIGKLSSSKSKKHEIVINNHRQENV